MFQQSRKLESEPVALHGLCCDAPHVPKSDAGEKHQEQRVDEADRPAYSLPCD